MGRIPDRWEEYSALGEPVAGTRFISFKVPLKEVLCRQNRMPSHLWFTPRMLLTEVQNRGCDLGIVIDLTNTSRYYHCKEILDAGVEYVKIFTEGHIVPSADVQNQFFEAVDKFLMDNANNDRLIGVHCTHGLNRTGYLVCRYMIDRMQFKPQAAIDAFNTARGYCMERENYLADLLGRSLQCDEKYSDIAECHPRSQPLHPSGHTASGHPSSQHNSHGPSNNYVDRHRPFRSDTMPPGRGRPRSSDFHTQWDFRSAASGWHPPNEEHRSVVDAAAHILPPYHHDDRHLVMPTGAGQGDWKHFEPTSYDVPFNNTVSFVWPPTHHSISDAWANGQASSGQMNGHGWSGQQWGQESEWTPVVNRRRHHYQRSRGIQSRRSRSRISPSTNRDYH